MSGHLRGCESCRAVACPPTLGAPAAPLAGEAPHEEAGGPLQPGQVLGSYRVVRRIESGGMGVVYEAVHQRLERRAAVKVLQHGPARNPDQVRRFLNEARAPNLVDHANVVQVYEIGRLPDGTDFILMEYLDGVTLRASGRDLAQVLRLAVQIATTLATAHAAGIVHRDLKPANVMVVRDPLVPGGERAKILDFGLAKLTAAGRADLDHDLQTPAQAALGTPRYMAPEQWGGAEQTGGQADVYSLGVMLYELLAGAPPFSAPHFGALMAMHLRDEPPSLQRQRPGLPPALAGLVHEMLAKDPLQRPTMAQVADRLGALAAAPTVLRQGEALPIRGARALWLRAPRRRVLWIGLGAAALAGAGGTLLYRHRLAGPHAGMVLIPGATFQMGSAPEEVESAFAWSQNLGCGTCPRDRYERELPARAVRVSSFFMDRTEVTNDQFATWLNHKQGVEVRTSKDGQLVLLGGVLLANLYPNYRTSGVIYQRGRFAARRGRERYPVTQVSWDAALRHCQDRGGRLPTEAEWELAARGTEGYRFPWGDNPPDCQGVIFGRIATGACSSVGSGPEPVGQAAQDRTPLGVLDLGGNVSEWVMDHFRRRYAACAAPCQDPVVGDNQPEDGGSGMRVARGGSWFLKKAEACRAAGRSRLQRDTLLGDNGFRCVVPIGGGRLR